MNDGGNDLVERLIVRSKEALEAAQTAADADQWRACANRLYYACFYAAKALLEDKEYGPKTHAGVRTLFNRHFVRPGIIPQGPAALYNELFDYRHKSDYDVFFEPDPTQLLNWIPETEVFISAIVDRIENR
jgi:uncharacterized protein (UPF0332 family)